MAPLAVVWSRRHEIKASNHRGATTKWYWISSRFPLQDLVLALRMIDVQELVCVCVLKIGMVGK